MPKQVSMKMLIGLTFALSAVGQTSNARLVGLVTDTTGAVIPGATVSVKNERTGESRSVTTNDQGYYVAPNLAPASYTISAKTNDLGPAQYMNIQVSVGQERSLNLILQPSTMVQEVSVSGGEL